jgi:hypothetical protein
VPPSALRTRPSRSLVAPVYAPRRLPNSSASTSAPGSAPQLTPWWTVRAAARGPRQNQTSSTSSSRWRDDGIAGSSASTMTTRCGRTLSPGGLPSGRCGELVIVDSATMFVRAPV